MPHYPRAIVELIAHFTRLPGIGPKTAERLVLHLAARPAAEVESFAKSLETFAGNRVTCRRCQSYTESDPCEICRSPRRNPSLLCLVAKPQDLLAIERTGEYLGRYWVLGGTVDPVDGMGLPQFHTANLLDRLQDPAVIEVVLAFNPDVAGEGTMLMIKQLLQPLVQSRQLRITKLARGLPLGSDVEYADEVTLSHALKGRRDA